jgi:trimeric autotransporter adhesin
VNRSTTRRAGLASTLAAVLALGALTALPAQAAEPITVEGEQPTSTNMVPGAAAQTGASGGQSLRLYTGTEAPTGGYTATYDVASTEASIYRLQATTIPVNVGWASPFRFKVNDGAWRTTTSAKQLAVVTSELRTYDFGAVTLAEGENTITFEVSQRRTEPNTHYTLFLDAFTLVPVDMTLDSVIAPDRFGVFEAGEEVALDASLNAAAPTDVPVDWEVLDYDGASVDAGTATVASGEQVASIALGGALETGSYRVRASIAGQETPTEGAFAVLPDRASRGDIDDSPFAVDVYGSKLIAQDDAEAFARVLQLTGVDWIRDRQRWNDVINPEPGVFDFSGEVQPWNWLEAADAAGLKTLSSFHDGPAWTRTSTRELPQDLRDMYAFALEAGEYYDGKVDAWQLWNEQNRKFALEAEGADRYGAVTKAAALGFLDSGSDARLVGGGLAGVDPHYAQWQFRNGILDYLDDYAYHTHTTVNSKASVNDHPDFSSQLEAAEPFGGDAKGRWVTEGGIALNNSDVTKLPTAVQEQLQARYIVSSAVESLAEGSTKHFFFIAAPYREGASYWSMYRNADEPMAALAAQSVMTDELGEGTYLGRLGGVPAGVRAHVFDSGAGPVAVLWAGEDTEVSLAVDGAASAADLMGRDAAVDTTGGTATLTVGPDPVYVAADGFGDLVAAPAAVEPAPRVTAEGFTDAERVVIQPVFDAETSKNAQLYGYGLVTDAATSVTAEVYNFGDTEVTALVSADAEGGWSVDGDAEIMVPAGGKVDVPFTITPTDDLRQSIADLSFTATVGGEQSSPTVAELRPRTATLSATHVIDGVDDTLRATYTNTTDVAQKLTHAEWTFGDDVATTTPNLTVAPGATATLDSPAAPAGVGQISYEVVLTAEGIGDTSVSGELSALPWHDVPRLANRAIDIDGVLDDLDGVPSQRLTAPGVDDDDIAATTWFTWDDEHLYLTAEVRDDRYIQPYTGNATWQADGLQFGIAPVWPGESDQRPEIQPRIEFGFALTPQGPHLYRYASGAVSGHLTDADIAAVRDEDTSTTVYEASVPWTMLDAIGVGPESAASLSIVANDTDGDGTRGWVQWGGGITTAKDSELFEPVIFAADSATAVPGSANVRAQCWGDGPRLAAHAYNDSSGRIDVRFSTPLGDAVVGDVKKRSGAYHAFAPEGSTVPAGDSLAVLSGDAGTRAFVKDGGSVTCE